jgi:mannitol-1-phosphate/altronate dehydrogenase
VQHEPFRQWVIEDDFVDGERPTLPPSASSWSAM